MTTSLDETLDVIARINKASKPQEICDGLTHFTSRFGLTSMIAGTMPAPNVHGASQEKHLLVSAFPDGWMNRYLEQEYVHVDPVIQRIQHNLSPFCWAESAPFTKKSHAAKAAQMLDEARSCKLIDGFAVPMITLEGSIAAVSLGSDSPIDLPDEAPGMIGMISSFAIGRAIELSSRNLRRSRANLTPREIECLKWAAEGKSEWEISVILNISEHTADKHLSNAHKKLKAANRAQAVANAIRLNVIS